MLLSEVDRLEKLVERLINICSDFKQKYQDLQHSYALLEEHHHFLQEQQQKSLEKIRILFSKGELTDEHQS